MSQNTIKIIIKSLAVLLGVPAALLIAFGLCMATISLIKDHNYCILFLIPVLGLYIYTAGVAYLVVRYYTNEFIKHFCIVLCILLFFIIEHFSGNPFDQKWKAHFSIKVYSLIIMPCSLFLSLGIPYLTYRILNYLNYKYINSNQEPTGNPASPDARA
ncbi:MAG: hypothetical protein WC637_04430 [Victivallales bacterium]|jgi:hypothetical protein